MNESFHLFEGRIEYSDESIAKVSSADDCRSASIYGEPSES
jgi:hypothetical protein